MFLPKFALSSSTFISLGFLSLIALAACGEPAELTGRKEARKESEVIDNSDAHSKPDQGNHTDAGGSATEESQQVEIAQGATGEPSPPIEDLKASLPGNDAEKRASDDTLSFEGSLLGLQFSIGGEGPACAIEDTSTGERIGIRFAPEVKTELNKEIDGWCVQGREVRVTGRMESYSGITTGGGKVFVVNEMSRVQVEGLEFVTGTLQSNRNISQALGGPECEIKIENTGATLAVNWAPYLGGSTPANDSLFESYCKTGDVVTLGGFYREVFYTGYPVDIPTLEVKEILEPGF